MSKYDYDRERYEDPVVGEGGYGLVYLPKGSKEKENHMSDTYQGMIAVPFGQGNVGISHQKAANGNAMLCFHDVTNCEIEFKETLPKGWSRKYPPLVGLSFPNLESIDHVISQLTKFRDHVAELAKDGENS